VKRWLPHVSTPAALGWAALLLFHAALTAALSRTSQGYPDESAYKGLAVNLATSGSYHFDEGCPMHAPFQPNTWYAPGWPALLAAGYRLARGEPGFWVVLGLVWCANAVLTWRLGSALGLPRPARWGLLLWLSLNPPLIYYHGHLMTEPVTIGLGLAILAAGVHFVRRPAWPGLCLLGALSAGGHLTRTPLLLPVVAVWAVALFCIPWRRLAPFALAFALVHAALVAPWLWRMHRLGAGWLMTEAKQGLHVDFLRNAPGQGPESFATGRHVELPPDFEALSPAERNGVLLRIALRRVWREPGLYLQNCLYRAGRLFSPVGNRSAVLFLYVPWALVLLGLVRGRATNRGEAVLLVAVLLWYLFLCATVARVRYRLPSDVWVAALALSLWQGRRRLLPSGAAGQPGQALSGERRAGPVANTEGVADRERPG
jgi:hypothetical protein